MIKDNLLLDIELINLLKEDEVAAFKEIYLRYWYQLYVVANKKLRCKESSEEIVQNLFTKFWINRKDINITGSLKAYLYTSVRYAIIDHLEKEATKKNYQSFVCYNNVLTDNSTEDEFYFHELEHTIEKEVEKLPSKCKSVFELSRKEYKTNREIALNLNISEKTVENHITNALRMIKVGLKKSIMFFFLF